MLSVASRKAYGAYYTSDPVARLISGWAVAPGDAVLDPSCGDGAFLAAAAAQDARRIVGVELSPLQAAATAARFVGNSAVEIVTSDFFAYESDARFDAIVGNPPFIRYHAFNGAIRERALFTCARAGVKLSKLTSSWAPFVVGCGELLRDGGRMGLVLPAELLHANYARPVLAYLRATFGTVMLITFRKRLFPDLSQDTLVLLASERGHRCNALLHVDAVDVEHIALEGLAALGRHIDAGTYLGGVRRVKESFVDERALAILERLMAAGHAYRLGDHASVDIGYVTGANEFFHLSGRRARELGISDRYLVPTTYRGSSLSGLSYSLEDWMSGNETGDSGYLFTVPGSRRLPAAIERYVNFGEERGFAQRFKCRIRKPWYVFSGTTRPAGFLTSMSGGRPTIVANDANVYAANSLHVLHPRGADIDVRAMSLGWLSSVSALSIEIEGHALGGGLLKLEPGEAGRVVVPRIEGPYARSFHIADRFVRDGKIDDAGRFVDDYIGRAYGLTRDDFACLRNATDALRQRRIKVR